MNFGNLGGNTTATSGFSFSAPITSTAQTATSFGATGGGDAGANKPGEPKEAPKTGFSFGAPASTAVSSGTTPLFGSNAALPPTMFSTAATSAATAVTSVQPLQTQQSQIGTGTTASLAPTIKATDPKPAAQTSQLNFSQLEDYINKWNSELEELAEVFINQATQVNAWDKVTFENNDKVNALSDAIEDVKANQHALEQELEFIATQHAELEESIAPLQIQLANIRETDADRTHTYNMAENLDGQLRQLNEDLKEVIEFLNDKKKGQVMDDYMMKLEEIVNNNTQTLEWVVDSATEISKQIDKISLMHDTLRVDSEKALKETYATTTTY